MKNRVIKILVADDHTLFRQGVIRLLDDNKEFSIVAEAENGSELIEKYFNFRPDIILTDIAMPGLTGIQSVQEIHKKDPKAKALFLSMYDEGEYVYKVIKSGGMGLVNKNILEEELFLAIEKVYNGFQYFGSKWSDETIKQLIYDYEKKTEEDSDFNVDLNFREEQILQMVIDGATSKEIADKMQLSKKTIDYYRSNLLRKFDIKTQIELAKCGIKHFELKKEKLF
ncbi:MAG: response regulator transcription factor [Ignavibacteriales bacterium]|nr:response regulator transcription factor [Ignavibacteriales bacterium]